ncbi:MAG: two-component regulator propeller domain-containing protein, partial [Bacteroidota bacterium]
MGNVQSTFSYLLKAYLLFILNTGIATAQEQEEWRFRSLKNIDGLSQNSVHSIVQDKHGFIWIGTEDGLNRYDGTRFKVYKNRPQDSTSLS